VSRLHAMKATASDVDLQRRNEKRVVPVNAELAIKTLLYMLQLPGSVRGHHLDCGEGTYWLRKYVAPLD